MSGRNRWYAYWRRIAVLAARRVRGVPRTLENWHQHDAAAYAALWAAMWRRASPDARIASFGIPSPTPEHNMLLATAEQLARTP